MQALVLAAGRGTRMKSETPKVLHEILGKPVLGWVLDSLADLGVKQTYLVVGSGADQVRAYLKKRAGGPKISLVYQQEQKGTGHAVEMARKVFADYHGPVLIWPGDMPLVEKETLKAFVARHRENDAAVSVLSAEREQPKGYGRIVRSAAAAAEGRASLAHEVGQGKFCAIREELDASEDERQILEVNTGIYLFEARSLFEALKKIKPANAKKEFYLTDTIEVLEEENQKVQAFALAESYEGQGINSRADLAEAIHIMKNREIAKHQENGVTFVAPEQTFVEAGAVIGQDTVVHPWTYIEGGVRIGKKCQIGPFAKIRKGSIIGDESVIGSFVEINRSKIGKKVMAKHLAYLGDAIIGDQTNVGAGSVTANYDGKRKHASRIGKNVSVGSNTVFVAPVTIGDRARTGAGSVITGGSRVPKGQTVAGVPAKPIKKRS